MAGSSRRRCNYGCGRHARARVVVCPCPPLFVRASHAVVHPRCDYGWWQACTRTRRRFACACARLVRPWLHTLSFVHAGVVAGMHAHTQFARARARPCSSVPAHAVVPLRSFVLVSVRLLIPVGPWLFVSARLCPGCACVAFARARVLVGVRLGLFVLVRPLFALIWACLCLMGLGVRGRERMVRSARLIEPYLVPSQCDTMS
jgi:hypothetical protein